MTDVLARFEERRIAREAERQRLHKRLNDLAIEGERDTIAVEQLKKVLSPSPDASAVTVNSEHTGLTNIDDRPSSAASSQQDGSGLMVKDMVLAIVRDAYPSGLTSRQIRGKAFLRYKQHINPNTLTVSLVRQSKGESPNVRCEGRTWFYIKPKSNEVQSLSGVAQEATEKEKSPEVAGLL